eukprot:6184445-Pleurochrysis_carterae.AAC.2
MQQHNANQTQHRPAQANLRAVQLTAPPAPAYLGVGLPEFGQHLAPHQAASNDAVASGLARCHTSHSRTKKTCAHRS